jgi:multimeric flavodoxin WrbA
LEANWLTLLALYGSSRRHGNSELLAEQVLQGLDATRIYLSEHAIRPIVDGRHDPAGFAPVTDDYGPIVDVVMAHDTLLFATPIYWYGMSGQMKLFVDRWSQSLREKRFDFKGELAKKRAFVVLAGSDEPRTKGLPLIQQFQYIFGFMGMAFGGYVIGEGNRPGEVLQDARALGEAAELGRVIKRG